MYGASGCSLRMTSFSSSFMFFRGSSPSSFPSFYFFNVIARGSQRVSDGYCYALSLNRNDTNVFVLQEATLCGRIKLSLLRTQQNFPGLRNEYLLSVSQKGHININFSLSESAGVMGYSAEFRTSHNFVSFLSKLNEYRMYI